MTRPFYVECFWAQDGTQQVYYRFQCRSCPLHGELQRWLSDAEIDGERHLREDHNESKAVA